MSALQFQNQHDKKQKTEPQKAAELGDSPSSLSGAPPAPPRSSSSLSRVDIRRPFRFVKRLIFWRLGEKNEQKQVVLRGRGEKGRQMQWPNRWGKKMGGGLSYRHVITWVES